MSLNVDVSVVRGSFTLDVAVTVAEGETLALLGPNGSGKTTVLHTVAGLLAPQRGSVEAGGRVLTHIHDGGRRMLVPPHERRVGLLGQDPLLFPHLTARDNVAFGARARGLSRTDSNAVVTEWLEAVGLAELGQHRPAQLSGGQQQRVAIARALAAEPGVLLLDEPMAALDVQNASAIRTLLRERIAAMGVPTIVVTHDILDAVVLADTVAILHEGRIIDVGATADVLERPTSRFAASLVGLNLRDGVVDADGSITLDGGRRVRSGKPPGASGERVTVTFPPSAVRVTSALAPAPGAPSWTATVGALEPTLRGIRVPFVDDDLVAEVSAADLLAHNIREGVTVTVSVDPEFVTVVGSPTPTTTVGG